MTQKTRRPSIGTVAYLLPAATTIPVRRYKWRSGPFSTELHEANRISMHDNVRSSSFPNSSVGYDAKSIINFYDRRPWEIGLRLNMLGLPLLGELNKPVLR